MKRLAGCLAAAVLVLAPAGASADAKALAGVWLVEPLYFDVMTDAGLVTPEFPVLVVAADGRFALYRVAVHCDALVDYERLDVGDEAGVQKACQRAHQRSKPDLGDSLLAILSAAGRWQSAGAGNVQFTAAELGRTPQYYERSLAGMRKDLADTAARVEKSARDDFTRRTMRENQERELQRMENFYTTLFVLNGRPLKFNRDGAFLRLQGDRESDVLVYRAVDRAVLEGAAGVIGIAGVSSVKYFRCAVEYLDKADPADRARQELLDIGRGAAAAAAVPDDPASWKRLNQRLEAHPAMARLRANKLGAYLGCPSRDAM